jgi:transposase
MEKIAYLGCDVSKGYADFILLNMKQEVVEKVFVLDDKIEGRNKLKELITNWQTKGLEQLFCGVESTGGYENNWYKLLKRFRPKGVVVKTARLNPKAVKGVGDASLIRTITDGVSAEMIARYLVLFSHKIDYSNQNSLKEDSRSYEARQQYTCLKMQLKQKVQLNNQLEKLLYQNFSEVLVYCRNKVPAWLLRLLVKYPCAHSVQKAGVAKLSLVKGMSKEKAEAVIKKLEGSKEAISKSMQHTICFIAQEIIHKEELIVEEKKYLQNEYAANETVKLLTGIKGIGVDSAIQLAFEIQDIHRFSTAAKLASYFGVHPSFKQSGDGVWKKAMSKKGRSEVRALLYMCSLSGIKSNDILKRIYARFRAKGMNHYAAMGVVMHKLLRIIFGVLKTKKAFDSIIDETNVANSLAKQQQLKQEKKETETKQKTERNRYQSTIQNDAPISKIKYQRIKKAASVPMPEARQQTDLLTAESNI